MNKRYRRFQELRMNAQNCLSGMGDIKNHLCSALIELQYLHENETPKLKWNEIKTILDSCKNTTPKGDEGLFMAAINAMTHEDILSLKRNIERL